MIIETGHFAVALALVLALVQSVLPLMGAARNNGLWMKVGGATAVSISGLLTVALLTLMHAYALSDFSVRNVAENSHSMKPVLYKIAGTWGNHEGSMLLWVWILGFFGLLVARLGGGLPERLRARTLAVQGMLTSGFLLFILFTSNPFLRVFPPPADGNGLNPVLQDPALAMHPPLLYLGYVGFSIVFSFAVAALIGGRVDPAFGRWIRPWVLMAWTSLTAGIALGSLWAYYELGWGGFWFWDPVENASLMPWLAGTALLHSVLVVEKRDALKSWTILLAILTFSLSLIGTFLVRSGILTSVHAFALDPERGVFILLLLGVTTVGGLALFALRAPKLQPGGFFAPVSREGALVLNNLLLFTCCATVFIGTLYPVFLSAVDPEAAVSVGPPYYTLTFVPLMTPLVILMGIGPLLRWKRADLPGALGRLKFAVALTVVAVLVTAYIHDNGGPLLAALGAGLGCWAVFATLSAFVDRMIATTGSPLRRLFRIPRAEWGMFFAHLGIGVLILGVTGAALFGSENVLYMKPGDKTEIAGYTVTFDTLEIGLGPNYNVEQGVFSLRNGGGREVMLAEKRWYPVSGRETTEVALRSGWRDVLHVVMGAEKPGEPGVYAIRLYHHPLALWIWFGAALIVFGGLITLADRRIRLAMPPIRRRKKRKTKPAPGTAEAGAA